MIIVEHDLLRHANAYIKDGILEKWRFDDKDKNHINAKLEVKYKEKEKITNEELQYIKTLGRVIIEQNNMLHFIDFTGSVQIFTGIRK